MPYQQRFVCAFCQEEGRETVLDAAWMKVQSELTAPGDLLACREHLVAQQLSLPKRREEEREAYRRRHRTEDAPQRKEDADTSGQDFKA